MSKSYNTEKESADPPPRSSLGAHGWTCVGSTSIRELCPLLCHMGGQRTDEVVGTLLLTFSSALACTSVAVSPSATLSGAEALVSHNTDGGAYP